MADMKLHFHAGHLGGGSGDALCTFLAALAMKHAPPEDWSSKYGTTFENEQFLMHPFCWCDRDSCPWCAGCSCPQSPEEVYLDGQLISDWSAANAAILGEYMGRFTRENDKADEQEWERRIAERNSRLKTVYLRRVHSCVPKGLMTDIEAGLGEQPYQKAPNFWHKPSGFKVWWYKYIGRDMETNGTPSEEMASLVTEADITKLCDSVEEAHKSFEAMWESALPGRIERAN